MPHKDGDEQKATKKKIMSRFINIVIVFSASFLVLSLLKDVPEASWLILSGAWLFGGVLFLRWIIKRRSSSKRELPAAIFVVSSIVIGLTAGHWYNLKRIEEEEASRIIIDKIIHIETNKRISYIKEHEEELEEKLQLLNEHLNQKDWVSAADWFETFGIRFTVGRGMEKPDQASKSFTLISKYKEMKRRFNSFETAVAQDIFETEKNELENDYTFSRLLFIEYNYKPKEELLKQVAERHGTTSEFVKTI